MQLSEVAQRVLGVLIEKEMATPQGYPLSLNALRVAANQTTNRDPVSDHDEPAIRRGLEELSAQSLVRAEYARRSSTPKYAHDLGGHLEVGAPALAVLAVLLLRGPQTVGELRQRTDRLHGFGGLDEVQAVLDGLARHHFGALVEDLPRQPGQKEVRWRHLLGAEAPHDGAGVAAPHDPHVREVPADAQDSSRGHDDVAGGEVAGLRAEVAALREELADLAGRVARLEG